MMASIKQDFIRLRTTRSATTSLTQFSACEKRQKMLTIRPSMSSESSSSSSSTRSKTREEETESCSLRKYDRNLFLVLVPDISLASMLWKCFKHRGIYLELKHVPDTINANQHQASRFIIVFIKEFDKHVETTSTDKHLQGQCRCLIHLSHKRRCFQTDVVRILPCGKFRDDWNSSNEAQVLLYFDIIQNDLYVLVEKMLRCGGCLQC